MSLVLFGGFDTRNEDRDEFIAFSCDVRHFSRLTQRFAFDYFQPNWCFTKLLQRNLYFMKVFASLLLFLLQMINSLFQHRVVIYGFLPNPQ